MTTDTNNTRAAAALLPTSDAIASAVYGAVFAAMIDSGAHVTQARVAAEKFADRARTIPAQENGSASEGFTAIACPDCGSSVLCPASPKPQGGAVSEDVRNLISEYERVGPKYWNGIGCFAQSWAEGAMKVLREYERARASDPPGADALTEAINDAKMLFNHAGIGTSAQNYASKVVTFLKSLQAPGADAGVGEAITVVSYVTAMEIVQEAYEAGMRKCGYTTELTRLYDAIFLSPPHPSATNNVSHPAVREVTEADVTKACVAAYAACDMGPFPEMAVCEGEDRRFVRAAINAVIAEAGVAK